MYLFRCLTRSVCTLLQHSRSHWSGCPGTSLYTNVSYRTRPWGRRRGQTQTNIMWTDGTSAGDTHLQYKTYPKTNTQCGKIWRTVCHDHCTLPPHIDMHERTHPLYLRIQQHGVLNRLRGCEVVGDQSLKDATLVLPDNSQQLPAAQSNHSCRVIAHHSPRTHG